MFKTITNIAKVLTAVGAIGGAALWLDARFDNQTEAATEQQRLLEYVNAEQSMMAEDILNIQDTLDKLEREHSQQGRDIENLVWAIDNIDNFTPEQMEELLNREFNRNRVYNRESDVAYIPIE